MRGRLVVAGLVLGAAITGVLVAAPASATQQTTIKAVVIGDSYSAGTGGGSYSDETCYRSPNSWAQHYVSWLNTQPDVDASLQNLACAGATTSEIAAQVAQIPADTNLVLFTAGGNDADFSTLVENCFAPVLRSGSDCKASIDEARGDLPGIQAGIQKILTAIDSKLADDATVVLAGYPLLSTDDSSDSLCLDSRWRTHHCRSPYLPGIEVRSLGQDAVTAQQDAVTQWNSTHPMQVLFVDSTGWFAGHEPAPGQIPANSARWINQIADTTDTTEWYHPNPTGYDQWAVLLEQQVGVPSV